MAKKLTQEYYINKCIEVHGDKYDYSLVVYKNKRTKIKIIRPVHGVFEQTPINHLQGSGCPFCNTDVRRKKDYVRKCKEKHNNKYDYSLIKYKNARERVKIICPEHGIFQQGLYDHLKGDGCPYCSGKKMNTELFIKKSKLIHNDKYDYELTKYESTLKEVQIICKKHGIFKQKPNIHLSGHGCPICKMSNKENEIISYLIENRIKYEYQKTFNGCKYKYKLYFDFYIPEYNFCIEYNGVQHYKPCSYFGGVDAYNKTKIRDKIKKEFCKRNNIKLCTISYKTNLLKKLNQIFNNEK